MEQSDTLLILPTYNEMENLERLLREIHRLHPSLGILVVDDNSPDGTGRLADALSREMPLSVIHRKGKEGIGSALRAGFLYALERSYRFVVTMDADRQHSPEYLSPMLAARAPDCVVIGSRSVPGGGFRSLRLHRWILTTCAHGLARWILGLPYDCTSGLRVYPSDALRRIDWRSIRSKGHAMLVETLFRLRDKGFGMREVPIMMQPREKGQSKILSIREILEEIRTLARLRKERRR